MVKRKMCYNHNMHKHVNREGFTMVELSLSLVFISILSIAVVLVISSAVSSYHKGITLGKINSVGSSLMRDMSFSIKLASPRSLKLECGDRYGTQTSTGLTRCETDSGRGFAIVTRNANVKANGRPDSETLRDVPVYGAFCTGSYSYIWNSGYFFNSEYTVEGATKASLKYKVGESNQDMDKGDFKLLKVKDESRLVCEAALRVKFPQTVTNEDYKPQSPNFGSSVFNIVPLDNSALEEEPTELLGTGSDDNSNLALYGLSTVLSEQSEGQLSGSLAQKNIVDKNTYYYTSFILGTIQGGIDIKAKGNNCATPEGYDRSMENLDYCAINKFNFAALATGG